MNPMLADFVDRLQSGQSFDALAVQREMSALWDDMQTEEDRVSFLGVHRAVMDLVERSGSLSNEQLKTFQGAREAEYRLFLTREAMNGGENVDPSTLDRITAREVAQGRMSQSSDFRSLAKAAGAVLGQSPPRTKGWFGKLFK